MIKNIKATALKGRTFNHKLGPLTMVTGPNDAGKSAITDAVRLVLLGHLPEQGKTNKATFALCSAAKLYVEATVDGAKVWREWSSKGGTVKYKEGFEGTEAMPEVPLITLDADAYFGASDRGKVDLVFSVLQLDPAKWTPATILADIGKVIREIGELPDLETLLEPVIGETVQGWLDRALELVAEETKTANATASRFTRTGEGISTLGLSDTPVDAARVAEDMNAAVQTLQALHSQLGNLQAVAKTSTTNNSRRRDLTQRIAELNAMIGDRELPDLLPTNEAIAELEAERAKLQVTFQHEQDEYARWMQRQVRRSRIEGEIAEKKKDAYRLSEARLAVDQYTELLRSTIEVDEATALEKANDARQQCAEIEGATKRIDADRKRLEEEYEQLAAKPACPTCGATGGEWLAEIEERFNSRRLALLEEDSKFRQRYESARQSRVNAEMVHSKAITDQKHRQTAERNLGESKALLQRAEHAGEMLASYRRELEELGSVTMEPPKTPPRLDEIAKELATRREDQQRIIADGRRRQYEEELAAIPAGDEESEQRLYHVECEIEATTSRIEELKKLEQKAMNQAADAKRIAEANVEREKELTRVQLLKASAAELSKKRVEMVDAAMKPLLEKVQEFTAGILPTPLEYRDGEIGRFNGNAWVPVKVFGGTHQAITFAGLQAALGASSPARLVIVDEMGRFDAKNKVAFLENVHVAISKGTLHQFIGIDVDAKPYAASKDMLTLIEVGK